MNVNQSDISANTLISLVYVEIKSRWGLYWGGDIPDFINLQIRLVLAFSFVDLSGLVCRLMASGTSPSQYGPHRLIIAKYEKSLLAVASTYQCIHQPLDSTSHLVDMYVCFHLCTRTQHHKWQSSLRPLQWQSDYILVGLLSYACLLGVDCM